METEVRKPLFARSILGGAFTGVVITIANLIYNIGYREFAGFSRALLVNVSSIIFATMTLLVVLGYVYYLLVEYFSAGRIWFRLLVSAMTAFVLVYTVLTNRDSGSGGFEGLYLGLELSTGLLCVLLLPYFARHDEILI
jgi:hypothetical protein